MTGTGILSTSQRREPNPSLLPFNGADNGLSIDNDSGKVVLGESESSSSAALLDSRQIPMDGFSLGFFLDPATNVRLFINENNAALDFEAGNNPDAIQFFVALAHMNGQPWTSSISNDGAGDGTECYYEALAGDALNSKIQVGAMADDAVFGDTAFVRSSNNAPLFVYTDNASALLFGANNLIRQRINPAGSIEFLSPGGTTVQEFSTNGDLAFSGSISTGNPSAGNANWMLGLIRSGVVVADLTRSVQVMIGGTLVNLLVST